MQKIKNKKRLKIIGLSIVAIIFISIIIILLVLNHISSATKAIKITKSLKTKQQELEQKFTSHNYTLENPNVIVDPYNNSPLTALVIFETKQKEKVKITIEGKDNLTTYTHEFDKEKVHYIPVYGLYADKENTVIIECGNQKKELKIKTEELPEDFSLPTSIEKEESKLTNDLYFFTPSSSGYTCAYDTNGDVRWYLTNKATWKIDRLENGHFLVSTERLVNSPYYLTGLYEMDMLGKIYVEYSLPGGYHHDYFEMPNGNLLVASDNFNNAEGTVEDYIVELDRKTGDIVKTIDLKDILNMEDGKSENWVEYDWFHNNSVWYDEKTNSITLSGRHQDAVINIDYDTEKLNWIIGDPTNWSKEYQKYFFKPIGDNFEWQWSQHAAMITPEGYVFIFDNGNNKSKEKDKYVDAVDSYSRGVMYKIDTKKMTIEQIWEYGKERGSEFYSPYISDVDYLDKNHYIVHSGGIVYVDGKNSNQPAGLGGADKLVSDTVEILDDEVIFEIKLPNNNYRVEKMPLYGKDTFKLGKANNKGTLGQTKVDSTKFGFMTNTKEIDKEYKSHDITITNEEDRLVIKGRFKRGTTVNAILYQNGKIKQYNIPISKRPYTAMCVDIFTEEENKLGIIVTKYINKEKLTGKYSLYLQINDKIYNTKQYIEG
ncbi:MAG TPA: aryl-sulfate sulfotransferase [Candidatus Faecimonas gallistercoris]|nr:aryl-sulfate sulfotransferase [Candidatus Faecimonas gallistercoris]